MAPLWPADVPWKQEWVRENGRVVGVRLSTRPFSSKSYGMTARSSGRSSSRGGRHSRPDSSGSKLSNEDMRPVSQSGGRLGPSYVSASWDKKHVFKPGREPLGRPLFCKRSGCRARFLRFNDLFDHNREHEIDDTRHKVTEEQSALKLQFRGLLRTPPDCVEGIFKECSQHRYLIPNDCASCKEVSETSQPRRPANWFKCVRFMLKGSMPFIINIADDQQHMPVVSARVGSAVGLFPIVTLSIIEDMVGRAWIAGRLLVHAQTLISSGRISEYDLPKDFNHNIERIEDASAIYFFPISDIVSWCFVGWCGPHQYDVRYSNIPQVLMAPSRCCCRLLLEKEKCGLHPWMSSD